MKLFDRISDSIFENLNEEKSNPQNKKAIEFLVSQIIRNKNKIESDVVPSFQNFLNNEIK
jgi:hypothetical protein